MKKIPRTANGLACEKQTYFRSSLLQRERSDDGKYVCGSQAANGRVQFGCQRNFFNSIISRLWRVFSDQNSTIPLVFKVWHSFYCWRSFFFFFFDSTFVFQVWFSFYSIEYSFFKFYVDFVLFNSTFNFFIRHLFFKFVIRFINRSSRFSTFTFVFQVQNSFY